MRLTGDMRMKEDMKQTIDRRHKTGDMKQEASDRDWRHDKGD